MPETDDVVMALRAKELANDLALPLVTDVRAATGTYAWILLVTSRRLELREIAGAHPASIYVDLLRGSTEHRLASTRSQRLPLARALGLHRGIESVVDATAGLGRDAVTLAACGCRVTAIERSVVLGALLGDGLARANESARTWLCELAGRVTLLVGDAREILSTMNDKQVPDAVYLDPMYPIDAKKALAKKEMRVCRQLVGDDDDAAELLAVAREVARRRVVVKRHLKAEPLEPCPSAQIISKQVRYDIYHSKQEARA